MITKRDFEGIASLLKHSILPLLANREDRMAVVSGFADYFGEQNPRFDRQRFVRAAYLPEGGDND